MVPVLLATAGPVRGPGALGMVATATPAGPVNDIGYVPGVICTPYSDWSSTEKEKSSVGQPLASVVAGVPAAVKKPRVTFTRSTKGWSWMRSVCWLRLPPSGNLGAVTAAGLIAATAAGSGEVTGSSAVE